MNEWMLEVVVCVSACVFLRARVRVINARGTQQKNGSILAGRLANMLASFLFRRCHLLAFFLFDDDTCSPSSFSTMSTVCVRVCACVRAGRYARKPCLRQGCDA